MIYEEITKKKETENIWRDGCLSDVNTSFVVSREDCFFLSLIFLWRINLDGLFNTKAIMKEKTEVELFYQKLSK